MSRVKVYWIDENGDRKDVDIGGEGYVLPTASETRKGGIKVGTGLEMSGDTLNCTLETYTLPTASKTVKGGVKVGNGLSTAGDALTVDLSTTITHIVESESPRIYVAENIYDTTRHNFSPYVGDNPESIQSAATVISVGELPATFYLIDGVYYYPWVTQVGGEFNVPYRGKENVTVRGEGYRSTGSGFVDVPEHELVKGEEYWIYEHDVLGAVVSFMEPDNFDVYPQGYTLTNVTVWADGQVAATDAISNIIIGDNLSLDGNTVYGANPYELPTASADTKGGIKIGDGFYMSYENDIGNFGQGDNDGEFLNSRSFFQFFNEFEIARPLVFPDENNPSEPATEFAINDIETDFVNWYGRASRVGDIISFVPTPGSGGIGYAYRTYEKWVVLSYSSAGETVWDEIVPFLSVEDRAKLDNLERDTLAAFTLGTVPSDVEGAMWIEGGAS